VQIRNFIDAANIEVVSAAGPFKVVQHRKDLSVEGMRDSMLKHYAAEMNYRKRQVVVELDGTCGGVILEAGIMQLMAGNLVMETNINSMANFLSKKLQAMVTGETIVKPLVTGIGTLITEPSYNHKIIMNISGMDKGLTVADGLFYACEATVALRAQAMSSASGALLGGKGLFNLSLCGDGHVIIDSHIPWTEIVEVRLTGNDELRVDGPYAIMWDSSLKMTVERSSKTLFGSAFTGEGLLNVYRGVGSVWMELTTPCVRKNFSR